MDSSQPNVVRRSWILTLYAGAITLRLVLAFLFADHAPQIVDAQDYDRLAIGLLEEGRYIASSGELTSLRPPLYPTLVATIYWVVGAQNWLAVCLVQSAISIGTVWFTQQVGTRLAGARVGFVAAMIVAFYPSLLALNCVVLSETLFSFFFTGSIWASVRLMDRGMLRDAFFLGTCLGLGALTRSILWACTPPLFLFLLIAMKVAWPRRVRLLAIAASVFAALLAPWAYRNTKVQETFTIVDVMGGRNVMMGNYEYTPMERSWATVTDVTGERAWHNVLRQTNSDYAELTQGQIDKRAMKYGVRFFFSNPVLTAQRCVVRFFNFWQLERTISAGLRSGLWGDVSKWTFLSASALFCGAYALVAIAAVLGVFSTGMAWRKQVLLLLWIALPCAIHTIAFAHSRYHLPVVPVLAIYASQFLVVSSRPSPVAAKRLVMGWLVVAVLVLGWLRELVFVDFAMLG